MTYKSKADLREEIKYLKMDRAHYFELYTTKRDELTDERIEHREELGRIRDTADRIVTREQEQYRILAEAIKSFYGVTPDEVIAALATQQELEAQKLLKDNLKKVKNANKTEEGK